MMYARVDPDQSISTMDMIEIARDDPDQPEHMLGLIGVTSTGVVVDMGRSESTRA